MFKFFIVISFSFSLCLAKTNKSEINNNTKESSRSINSYIGDLQYFYDTYKECSETDLATCLKEKLLMVVNRVERSQTNLKIVDGIDFVRDPNVQLSETLIKSKKDLDDILPRSLHEKSRALDSMIFDKILSFFKQYTLQVKFPSIDEMQRSMEARGDGGFGGGNKGGGFGNKGGKDKKNGQWIMIPLLLGSTLVPLAFGALALLAGKALIVSKLALALASIIGIKKLISGSGHHHEAAHEVVVSGGHGSGWGRIGGYSGQNMAYNGYTP